MNIEIEQAIEKSLYYKLAKEVRPLKLVIDSVEYTLDHTEKQEIIDYLKLNNSTYLEIATLLDKFHNIDCSIETEETYKSYGLSDEYIQDNFKDIPEGEPRISIDGEFGYGNLTEDFYKHDYLKLENYIRNYF